MKLEVNQVVEGIVSGITPYGIFMQCGEYSGLVHISEITNSYVEDVNMYAKLGDHIMVKILSINEETKKLKLSMRRVYKKQRKKNALEYLNDFEPLRKSLEIWTKEKEKEYNL